MYVAYTSRQNALMAADNHVFRFLFDPTSSIQQLKEDIRLFLNGESDPEQVKRFGGNRSEQEPDPTLPEATFERFHESFPVAFSTRRYTGEHTLFSNLRSSRR
jgi:hypothetical protein